MVLLLLPLFCNWLLHVQWHGGLYVIFPQHKPIARTLINWANRENESANSPPGSAETDLNREFSFHGYLPCWMLWNRPARTHREFPNKLQSWKIVLSFLLPDDYVWMRAINLFLIRVETDVLRMKCETRLFRDEETQKHLYWSFRGCMFPSLFC